MPLYGGYWLKLSKDKEDLGRYQCGLLRKDTKSTLSFSVFYPFLECTSKKNNSLIHYFKTSYDLTLYFIIPFI